MAALPRAGGLGAAVNGGYWILLWDGWSAGLVMINPRLHSDGSDMYGNPRNWWPRTWSDAERRPSEEQILKHHGLDRVEHARVIWGDA